MGQHVLADSNQNLMSSTIKLVQISSCLLTARVGVFMGTQRSPPLKNIGWVDIFPKKLVRTDFRTILDIYLNVNRPHIAIFIDYNC